MSRRYAVFGRFLIYPLQHITEITKAVHALPNTRYYVDAWDFYHNGIFQHTRYYLMQI